MYSNPSENSCNKIKILSLLSIIICLLFFIYLRVGSLGTDSEYGVDVYYHIKMGELFPGPCVKKTFHWTQLSVWKNFFYDKELAFHALLGGIKIISDFLSIPFSPPYNFFSASLVFLFFSFPVFFMLKLKISFAYLFPFLVLSISPLFLLRISMIRPHILSIILNLLTAFILISKIDNNKKKIYIFLMGFIYAYSYSSPHLILLPIISYLIAYLLVNRQVRKSKAITLLPLIAIVGVFVGLLIHPQSPNTLYLWYIQGVMVVRQILGEQFGVGLGTELLSPSKDTLISNSGIYILFIINLISYIKLHKKSVSVLTFLIAQAIMLFGFFFSERCVEYALPYGVVCFIFLLENHLKQCNKIYSGKIHIILILTVSIFSLLMLDYNKKILKYSQFSPCSDFGKKVLSLVPTGSYIGQIRWGDFPMLFNVASNYNYSMAMDPMFTYAYYPKKIVKLENFRQLKKALSPGELEDILGTNLVFISKYDPVPARHLIANKAKILYKGKDGYLLQLSTEK